MGKALADPPSSLVFAEKHFIGAHRSTLQRSYPSPNDPASFKSAYQQSWFNPTTPTRSSPVPVEKGIVNIQEAYNQEEYLSEIFYSNLNRIESPNIEDN